MAKSREARIAAALKTVAYDEMHDCFIGVGHRGETLQDKIRQRVRELSLSKREWWNGLRVHYWYNSNGFCNVSISLVDESGKEEKEEFFVKNNSDWETFEQAEAEAWEEALLWLAAEGEQRE